MRRVLTILFFSILFILLITLLVYIWGITKLDTITTKEKNITDILLVTLELIGILVTIFVVSIILFQYFRYRRPYRLVFDAFSNEPDLISNEKKPLNLSILVQEELIHQFKIIYHVVHGFSDKAKDKKKQDFEAFGADDLYIEEGPLGNGLGTYVSIEQVKKGGMIEDLKEVIENLKDPKGVNLMSLIGEIVSKDVAPVSKFIEAILPPHVIQATAYLQWRSNVADSNDSDDADKVGITFKYVDLSNQRNLMVRTLWWQPEDKSKENGATRSAKRKMVNKDVSSKVADRYIELLGPATYWMALMFWEQKLLSNVPPPNRIFTRYEKRRQARIFYLMGALYFAHADQFPAYKGFFCQLAVEHLRQAIVTDASWNLPCLYLANLYSFKAQETKGEKSDKLREDAQELYNAALERTRKKNALTRPRILIAQALAELSAGVKLDKEELINQAIGQIEQLNREIDPAKFDPERADCSAYLYNLAIWYKKAADGSVSISSANAEDQARRYLAYSLIRSPDLRETLEKDKNFESWHKSKDLEILFELLDEVRNCNPGLAKLKGEEFTSKLDPIPSMIDQRIGRLAYRQEV